MIWVNSNMALILQKNTYILVMWTYSYISNNLMCTYPIPLKYVSSLSYKFYNFV